MRLGRSCSGEHCNLGDWPWHVHGQAFWRVRLENRQNRLARLLELEAPDILVDTEKRMIATAELGFFRAVMKDIP